uniref:Uncharacterized protein n=1 Tax=Tetraodon nigroviridis TaxID=99883 RepID=H3BZR4_TETNG
MRKKKLKMRHNRTTLVPPTSTTSQMETASGSACTRTTGRTSATQTEVFNVCGMDYLTGSWVLEDLYSSNIPGRPGVDQRRDAWTVLLSPWSSFLSSHHRLRGFSSQLRVVLPAAAEEPDDFRSQAGERTCC